MSREQTLADVNELKEALARLKERSRALAASHGADPELPESDLGVDSHTVLHLDAEVDDKVDLTRKKLARVVQKSQLSVDKLKDYFYDAYACHDVTVSALATASQVSTIKTKQLSTATKFGLYSIQSQLDSQKSFATRAPLSPHSNRARTAE